MFTFSLHVGANYPSRKYDGDRDVALERWVKGDVYLAELKAALPAVLSDFRPDLAIYIAGVDVHKDDRFGQMSLSTEEMYERDRFTLSTLRDKGLPVATVFGGGYNKDKPMTAWLHCQTLRVAAHFM